jgi:menaquinol-cytochrome c reductase iron-sulfur subunit
VTDEDITRRELLGRGTAVIGALITAGLAIPAIAYIVGPALREQVADWIRLGSTAKVEIGTPTLFKASIERQTGWIQSTDQIAAYVLTDNGRDYVAMSNICTHLACRVRWVADREQFLCPCHNGIFDKEGNVVSGPPPEPLERYEVQVDNDTIMIKAG